MMTFDGMNGDSTSNAVADNATAHNGAPEQTSAPQADAKPPVAADVIPAELPHPTTMGSPLSRGARYMHHFEVELISDGKRLWHVLSAEGQAVVDALFHERRVELSNIEAAKAGS